MSLSSVDTSGTSIVPHPVNPASAQAPAVTGTVVPFNAPSASDFEKLLQSVASTANTSAPIAKNDTTTPAQSATTSQSTGQTGSAASANGTSTGQTAAGAATSWLQSTGRQSTTTQSGLPAQGYAQYGTTVQGASLAPSGSVAQGTVQSPYSTAQSAPTMAYMLVPVMMMPVAAATSTAVAPGSTLTTPAASSLNASTPALQMPFIGSYPVTQTFGPTSFAAEPSYDGYSHFHTGVDYGVPEDTQISAAAPGKVVAAGWTDVGFGNEVVVDHGNGVTTLYGHLDKVNVKVGDTVQAGQALGLSGSTGNSTGPHLHFGVEVNGKWVDPSTYVAGAVSSADATTAQSGTSTAGTASPSGMVMGTGLSTGVQSYALPAMPNVQGYVLQAMPVQAGATSGLYSLVPAAAVATQAPTTTGIGGSTTPATWPSAVAPASSTTASSIASTTGTLGALIDKVSTSTGVSSSLLAAVVQTESGGNAQAVSSAGAKGLMQLMDGTAATYGVKDSFDPEQNLTAGAQFLSSLLSQFGGSEQLALAAYNAGPGAVTRYGGVPPYGETQQYVQKVMQLQKQYSSQ